VLKYKQRLIKAFADRARTRRGESPRRISHFIFRKELTMHWITKIAATLTALEFFYIFYLETLATASERTAKVFGMDLKTLESDAVSLLFKNQGVYNGLIAVLILLAVFAFASKTAVICLMATIVAVALYDSVTSNPKIILMQGGLAILTLISCLL
jgi:putative membrane protein